MDHCNKVGATVIFEWPTNNLYWKEPKVKRYFSHAKATSTGCAGWTPLRIHGCAYGLTSVKNGRPIMKTVDTDDESA